MAARDPDPGHHPALPVPRRLTHVKELVPDRDGQVTSAVVDVGAFLGMGGKYVVVNLRDLKSDHNRLTLDLTREHLQKAQNYRLEDPNTGAGTSISPVHGGHLGNGL